MEATKGRKSKGTNSKETAPNNLNELLEDALEDLLLNDDTPTAADEKEGQPNIEESLKKITALGKDDARDKEVDHAAGSSASTKTGTEQSVVDEEEMNRFFASMTEKLKAELPQMDPQEAQIKLSESVPQIFDLMQNLLSKELLYPALKDLEPKFAEWMEKNLAKLSKDDRRRYEKQMGKIREIIDVFDDESLQDKERFEKNLELMEQMQSYGAPPEELTVPDGMSRCSVM